jgi:polyphosphate kinase
MDTNARCTKARACARAVIVRSDDKRRGRLNCISHILKRISYERVSHKKIKLPKRSDKHKYDDQVTLNGMKFVAEKY